MTSTTAPSFPTKGPDSDRRPCPIARRNVVVPGVPLTLDGQTWYLAAAVERYRPAFEGDLMVGVSTYRGFPPRSEAAVAEMLRVVEDGQLPVHVLFTVGASLLRAAHNLSAEEAAEVLDLDGPGVDALVDAVVRAVRGQIPVDDPHAHASSPTAPPRDPTP